MEGLLFLFGLFLALGLFFLTASVLKLPTMGAAKAMLGTVKQERKAAKTLETYFMILAVRLSGFIRMDAYKRSRMQSNCPQECQETRTTKIPLKAQSPSSPMTS